jgi:hypothetical protein
VPVVTSAVKFAVAGKSPYGLLKNATISGPLNTAESIWVDTGTAMYFTSPSLCLAASVKTID